MKAVAFTYKSTEAKTVEIPKPELQDDEVLIKVSHAALDTALDPVIQRQTSASYLHKFTDPLLCGWHFSGTVDSVGSNVATTENDNNFRSGDEVYGFLPYNPQTVQGSLSEYITVKSDACAHKPKSVSHDIAAASSTESITALQGLRDHGGLTKGDTVLINGAGGAVGIAAIQIAKRMNAASITAICSTKDVDRVKKLGAHVVIDRKVHTDVLSQLETSSFDVIFDTPSVLPIAKTLKYLKSNGNYVLTAPYLGMLWGVTVGMITRKGVKMFVVEPKRADLELLGTWLGEEDEDGGGFEVDTDSTFPIRDVEKAAARNRDTDKKGRVVVQVENGW